MCTGSWLQRPVSPLPLPPHNNPPLTCNASSLYELFFPLEGRGSHRGGNPRKMGKNYKIPLSGATPENGEKLQKNYKNCIFGVILPLFWGNFPHFRGLHRGGEFCNFSPIFRGFPPRWLPGPSKGKNNSQSSLAEPALENWVEVSKLSWLSFIAPKGICGYRSDVSSERIHIYQI